MSNIRHRTAGPEPTRQHQQTALLRPPEKTCRQKARDLFWDKSAGTCLTRSPINWLSITIYYAIFLGGILLIFYISMLISEAVASRDSNRPQYVLGDSLIGTSPSLNYFPLRKSRSLIWLSDKRDYSEYVKTISDEFESYKKKNDSFNPKEFAECSQPPYGYNKKTPCLFFRLNRILLWKPQPYRVGDEFPEEMPASVRKLIEEAKPPKIWFTCNGTTAKDRDHISQDFFQIQGDKGFPTNAYPFKRQKGFLDPIIAMKLNDPSANKTLYTFTCSVWALNINRRDTEVQKMSYDWDEAQRNTVRQGTQALIRTAESLERSERVALETTEAGTAIISELRTQTESLERAKSNLQHMNDQLSQSQKIIRTLYKRVFTNKFIVLLIIVLEIAILGTVVYLKFFRKH